NKGVKNGKELINECDGNEGEVDAGEINKVRERVNRSKNDVNGNEKLGVGKRDGNTRIDGLSYVNEGQGKKGKENVGKGCRKRNIRSELED
ncbi:GA module-containing protein, partial [Staphylococcus epidermidis]|uniref:GA module-containing protein n=1 Tax=Staphylococcus epidermidis TaxID=1282 RepID=UPI0011A49233